jgi:hypothetical protein
MQTRLVLKFISVKEAEEGKPPDVSEVISLSSIETDHTKFTSPGIRTQAHYDLDKIMDMLVNQRLPVEQESDHYLSLRQLIKELQVLMSRSSEADYSILKRESVGEVSMTLTFKGPQYGLHPKV